MRNLAGASERALVWASRAIAQPAAAAPFCDRGQEGGADVVQEVGHGGSSQQKIAASAAITTAADAMQSSMPARADA